MNMPSTNTASHERPAERRASTAVRGPAGRGLGSTAQSSNRKNIPRSPRLTFVVRVPSLDKVGMSTGLSCSCARVICPYPVCQQASSQQGAGAGERFDRLGTSSRPRLAAQAMIGHGADEAALLPADVGCSDLVLEDMHPLARTARRQRDLNPWT